ncbi:Ferric reductase like transmembrane component domain containing protein [Amanita muscaria]
MADTGSPIVVPSEMQPYNSYVEDPKWQIRFTIAWTSLLGLFVVFALPRVIRRLRTGTFFIDVTGLKGDYGGRGTYERVGEEKGVKTKSKPKTTRGRFESAKNVMDNIFGSMVYWSLPRVELNAGQIFIISAYLVITIVCIVCQAPLVTNPNRPGFLAIAQLPPVFLFATKNSLVSFVLGPGVGYEKLNFIHRWSSRGLLIAALTHGVYWIKDHLTYNMPILGPQKETSGVACLSLLCVIFLTSLRPVRRMMWNAFWIVHTLCYTAFLITVCYHTIYARPWVYAPVAFYGLDLLLRMVKMRIQDAVLVPADNLMTLINVPYMSSGWTVGQHVRLRVFFGGRLFESHPLTIMCAPPSEGTNASEYAGSGILLGARAVGDWTKALNEFALREGKKLRAQRLNSEEEELTDATPVPVHVMIDGPYGGCSVDPSSYETVLLVSGGSGVTFTIGVLDALVGKYIRSGPDQVVTRKIEFVWFIRSYGQINWFASLLKTIALHASSASPSLDLHITIYVTCLCTLENLPEIPNCDVLVAQPGVSAVVRRVVEGNQDPAKAVEEGDVVLDETPSSDGSEVPVGDGGFVVCASGPERLTREAANAVAKLKASSRGQELGRIGLHTELYAV